jgi:uncharacterized protein YbjT (DUF2867 family)
MILVTGSTGLNGSAVIREFARHSHPVRALVRDRERAAQLGAPPASVEIVEGDMSQPETLAPALDGVHRVLMISTANNDLAETQRTFVDAVAHAGVPHVVKFSGIGCEPGSPFRFARVHGEIEHHLEASGLAWTHLRPSQFMQVYFREVRSILGDRNLAATDPWRRSGYVRMRSHASETTSSRASGSSRLWRAVLRIPGMSAWSSVRAARSSVPAISASARRMRDAFGLLRSWQRRTRPAGSLTPTSTG